MIAKLPRDLWKHIRSFSGDTGTEPTPTAKLIKSLAVIDDSSGTFMFPFGKDGYASTVHLAPSRSTTFFHRRAWEYTSPSYFRVLHMEYDRDSVGGWPIRARSFQ